MILSLIGWRRFFAFRDKAVDIAALTRVGEAAKSRFLAGINGPHSGRIYSRRGGGAHRASAPGEFPAHDSGRHRATVDYVVGRDSVDVGSGMFYARFLRDGTSRMRPRAMSKEALTQTTDAGNMQIGRFVRWRRGR